MEKVYFVSFVVTNFNGSYFDTLEVRLPRKIRNYGDIKSLTDLIQEQINEKAGSCRVTIIGWKELDEPTQNIQNSEEQVRE